MSADLNAALLALEANPHDPAVWKTLGLMVIAQGIPEHLALFQERERLARDAVPILFHALFNDELVENQPLRARLVEFADHTGWQTPIALVIHFFAACARLYDRDPAGAQAFRQVADAIAQDPQPFASVPPLARCPQFARLITSPAETRSLWSSWGSLPQQEIIWSDRAAPAPGSEPVIFAACDGGYFKRFSAHFAEVAAGLTAIGPGPVHIHIVNPAPGQMEGAGADAPNLFLSHETVAADRRNSTYYACARFFAAAEVMRRYGRDMLMLDIDLDRTSHLDTLMARARQSDIAYFAMPTLMPWLRHHAAFIHFRNSPGVAGFMDRFANLLSHQLPGAVWYVDQLCLASAVAAYGQEAGGLKIDGLERADGFPFAHFVMPAGADAEKEALRREGSA